MHTQMDMDEPLDLSIPGRPCVTQGDRHSESSVYSDGEHDVSGKMSPNYSDRGYPTVVITEARKESSKLPISSMPTQLSPNGLHHERVDSPEIDPSATNKPIRKTVGDITVTLHEPCLWQTFGQHGTEMIINRNGRRMFPHLDLSIEGLNPTQLYNILLEVCSADNKRYKFISNRWIPVGGADPMEQNPPVIHHDSPNVGAFWMRKVSFAKVKLTNYKDSNEGSIVLHSMHKYMAKIIIEPAGADGKGLDDKIVIPFDETKFFAVTAYQNETIIQLKIHNNPFAKAFRYPRRSSRDKSSGRSNRSMSNKRNTNMQESILNQPSKRCRVEHSNSKSPSSTVSSPSSSPTTSPEDVSLMTKVSPVTQYFGMNGQMDMMNPMCLPLMGYRGIPGYPMPPFVPPMYYPQNPWMPQDMSQAFNNTTFSLPNLTQQDSLAVKLESPTSSPGAQV